jgi:Family of unknown function (DUF5662)
MFAFYERRTNEHIERVRNCLALLANGSVCRDELLERAAVHDASKFGPEERLAYVWLTEFHRCRRAGEPFEYPAGIAEQVSRAVQHHVTTNRHHPEFHADPNDMTEIDLIEMVCDWTAMAQEFNQDGGSARGWADKTIGVRVHFNEEKRRFVYAMIAELDRRVVPSS